MAHLIHGLRINFVNAFLYPSVSDCILAHFNSSGLRLRDHTAVTRDIHQQPPAPARRAGVDRTPLDRIDYSTLLDRIVVDKCHSIPSHKSRTSAASPPLVRRAVTVRSASATSCRSPLSGPSMTP
ncbi:hypothetical protein EVAR_21500_1 [Eumeta japonica]|uniref:Uncharacterized protein n=1 Tax=Eumeta variegata TaxID=151549 RepID=A0A4C1UYA5_EUMVA|nr:hypothetical protein EVAR_21500_1 [Eumeta japonica]